MLPSFDLDKTVKTEALTLGADSRSKTTDASIEGEAPSTSAPFEAGEVRGRAASPLPQSLLDSDKLYLKALTTYGLLQKVGFTAEQAEAAIKNAPGFYDLEECIAHLVSNMTVEELTDVSRAKAAADEDTSETLDTTRPPRHDAYSFERTTAPRRELSSQTRSKSKKGEDAHEDRDSPTSASEADTINLTHALRGIAMSCSLLHRELEEEISEGQEGAGLMDTLESPSTAWARSRLGQIKIDRLKGRQSKLVKAGALKSAAFDAEKSDRIYQRLSDVMRTSEMQRDFNKDLAADCLRQERADWEERLRQEEEAAQEQADCSDSGEPRSQTSEADPKNLNGMRNGTLVDQPEQPTDVDPELQQPSDVKSERLQPEDDGASSTEGEGMFGDLLDEENAEVIDTASGVAIRVRPLPSSIKSGKTPKSLLTESLRRLDPAANVRYEPVTTGGRLYRSRLTLRWPGMEGKKSSTMLVDVFQLTGEGAESQSAADDMLATLALNCVERDRATSRGLPGPYRDWWDELELLRKQDKDSRAVETLKKIKAAIQSRLDEIQERKRREKEAAGPATGPSVDDQHGQLDAGALARGEVPPLTSGAAQSQKAYFEERIQSGPYRKMLPVRQNLPIYKYREHILDVVEDSQVFVLSGETGCGKSTQLPAYILEHCMSQGKPCKIYCTEPRRISAISLAERVSQELGEPKGSVGGDNSLIGYAIRLDSHIGRQARLVYATSGILLRMLEGTSINEVTHIIIDEVHERSIESDFLLIILKTIMQHRKDLKVILMSATLDAERLSAYFGGCPTVAVPGRTFPVQTNYLEDAVELTNYTIEDDSPYSLRLRPDKFGRKSEVPGNRAKLKSTEEEELLQDEDDDNDRQETTDVGMSEKEKQRYSPKTISTMNRMDEYVINHDLIVSLLERICFSPDLQHFSSAVLVFMPGLQDIRKLHELLLAHKAFGSTAFMVSPLHSTLSSEEQSAVFNIPPKGIRKIVISTNIAETGVTIPDVTCVIDSGKHREMRFDEKRQTSRLLDCFIARSNAKQRRGRAGRVQEGIAFHLFTKQRHDKYVSGDSDSVVFPESQLY